MNRGRAEKISKIDYAYNYRGVKRGGVRKEKTNFRRKR